MRTKEEILAKHSTHYSSNILRAMDVYAKEVAIDFCDWLNMNKYEFETMESKELFELYLKSKSNEQQH